MFSCQYKNGLFEIGIVKPAYIHIDFTKNIFFDATCTIKSPCANGEKVKVTWILTFWLLDVFQSVTMTLDVSFHKRCKSQLNLIHSRPRISALNIVFFH